MPARLAATVGFNDKHESQEIRGKEGGRLREQLATPAWPSSQQSSSSGERSHKRRERENGERGEKRTRLSDASGWHPLQPLQRGAEQRQRQY
jgi:hypothetical protein